MNETLRTTIEAYLDESYNDGIDQGRINYKRDMMQSLTNYLHEKLTEGKLNQAEALSELVQRLEQLN